MAAVTSGAIQELDMYVKIERRMSKNTWNGSIKFDKPHTVPHNIHSQTAF